MAGNVWEWCEDWFDDNKTRRVLRGGSWYFNYPINFRCAYRGRNTPDVRDNFDGFRCVVRADTR